MTIGLTVLTNVEVPVTRLAAACEWYCKRLGFVEHWRGDREAFVALPGEGVRFFLVQTADSARLGFTGAREGVQHGVVDFYAPDLAAAHGLLRSRGVDVDELQPGMPGFGFRDLDGNRFGVHSDRGSYEHRKNNPTL